MKKAIKMFSILFFIVVALTFSSCKANNEVSDTSSTPEDKKSSTIVDSQPADNTSQTLLRRISSAEDLNSIESIIILDETPSTGQTLTGKENLMFLSKYTFSHNREDKRENWDGWLSENSVLSLRVDMKEFGDYYLYLMQDGSIAIQVMCGDSEVPELSYDFYTADKEYTLTKEKLESLSNKED